VYVNEVNDFIANRRLSKSISIFRFSYFNSISSKCKFRTTLNFIQGYLGVFRYPWFFKQQRYDPATEINKNCPI